MKLEDKRKTEQLADALMADVLQQENTTDLYHSLERFYKGMRALESYVYVKEAIHDSK